MAAPPRPIPTKEEILSLLKERSNWGRWGPDDQAGAVNLITQEKRLQAASLVRSGRTFSLSRPFPKKPGPSNPNPAQHYVFWNTRPGGDGYSADFFGILPHGYECTHIDALNHTWDADGMYNGRKPEGLLSPDGIPWGDIDVWRDGIVTRAVLLDVPGHRGEPHVSLERPVHDWELEEIAAAQGVEVTAGDALLVYSGREELEKRHPDISPHKPPSPGLHASCLRFLRDHDVAVLGWDLADAMPNEYGLRWTVHHSMIAYGVVLLDGAVLGPLAKACREEGRWELMLVIAPLSIAGATGSPVNPIAII